MEDLGENLQIQKSVPVAVVRERQRQYAILFTYYNGRKAVNIRWLLLLMNMKDSLMSAEE